MYTLELIATDSRRTLAASYIRRHPIKAELWSWLETTIEAVLLPAALTYAKTQTQTQAFLVIRTYRLRWP
jgi:hypothetical protein